MRSHTYDGILLCGCNPEALTTVLRYTGNWVIPSYLA